MRFDLWQLRAKSMAQLAQKAAGLEVPKAEHFIPFLRTWEHLLCFTSGNRRGRLSGVWAMICELFSRRTGPTGFKVAGGIHNPPPHLAGRAGVRAPAKPPTPHFYRRALASPALPSLHFYRQALGRPGLPQALTFINGPWAGPALPNTSLLLTGPRPAWPGPTPHFYWPAQIPHFYWLSLAKFGPAGGFKLRPRRARWWGSKVG